MKKIKKEKELEGLEGFLNVGVVGYSKQDFDQELAEKLINDAFGKLSTYFPINIVSGLTNQGIPAIAYKVSKEREWKSTGIACGKVNIPGKYELYDVDFKFIIGDQWGDESETFINSIDVLIRVGGGDQSKKEVLAAKERNIPVFEYDL